MILINAFITDLYWAWISYTCIMELFSLKILLFTFPFFSIPINYYELVKLQIHVTILNCGIRGRSRKTFMHHLEKKDPLSCAYFINCKCIWERFASHGVRTPLITDESMAIYAENTDIDTTNLCKFEARKRKVLWRAMMLETVARIKNL